MPKKDQTSKQSETGPETPPEEPEESPQNPKDQTSSEDGPDDITVEEIGGGFQHEMLKGKSPEEIERYVSALEGANQEIGSELTELQRATTRQLASQPKDEGDEVPPMPEKAFVEDPEGYFEAFEQRINRRLQETIKPFQENLAATNRTGVRQKLRNELKHFGALEPTIDAEIRKAGSDPSQLDEQQLRQTYHIVVGYLAENGKLQDYVGGDEPEPKDEEPQEEPSQPQGGSDMNIPQHRPSSAPLPPKNKGGGKPRELTENERTLARQRNMTAEEYLEWQNRESDDIVQPGFSIGGEE